MRKLLSISVAVLLALPMVACDEQPTELDEQAPQLQQAEGPAAASPSHSENAAARSEGTFARPGWGNDHLWEFIAPKPTLNPAGQLVFGSEANPSSHEPFYVVGNEAGDDGAQSQAFFGPHDHAFAVPPNNGGTFNANWHIQVAIPGPDATVGDNVQVNEDRTIRNAFFEDHDMNGDRLPETADLVYAVKFDGDNAFTDLTSAQKVEKAVAQGLVSLILSPEVFVCPVKDIEG